MEEKEIVEPIKKGASEEKAKNTSNVKKSKKVIIIVVGILLVIATIAFVFFKQSSSGTKITFYRYKNELFTKGHGYIEDIENNNLSQYTYKCTNKKCAIISSKNVGLEIRDDWVLIDDSDNLPDYASTGVIMGTSRDDYYVLYNVVKNKKIMIFLNNNMGISDLLLDKSGIPVAMIVSELKDDGVSSVIIDLKTDERLIDSNDIIYGSTRKDYRGLSIINNGKDDYYLFTSKNYGSGLLYDKNLNYIVDIVSDDYFDDEGNIIKVIRDDEKEKDYFVVYNTNGSLIRTSKLYDNIEVDSGYLMVQNGDKVSIYNSQEKELIEISKQGKKYEYSTYYNKYYLDDKNVVSIFEIQKPDDEVDKKVTRYKYDIKNNKLDKESMKFDGYLEPYSGLSRFYLEGYDTKKISNSTFYFDKAISKSRIEKLQKLIDELYENKLAKKMFSAKQNIYLFSTYNYQLINKSDYFCNNSASITLYNFYADGVSINDMELISKMAVNYYNDNYKKLNNNAFKKLYDKYYSYFDQYQSVGITCNSYNKEGLFSYVIGSYYIRYFGGYGYSELENFRRRIDNDGLLDEFDEQVEKYVESYVLK